MIKKILKMKNILENQAYKQRFKCHLAHMRANCIKINLSKQVTCSTVLF